MPPRHAHLPFFALWLLVMLRVFGGAVVLHLLGAPSWAVAAWLMIHLRFKVAARR
jgi:hypothetical protein